MQTNKSQRNVKIISEIHPQFLGSTNEIKRVILQSKIGGSDYVKVQLYNSKKLFNNQDREYLEISKNELKDIKKFSEDHGIELTASIFDEESLNFVQDRLRNKYIKIPSGELNNYFILDKIKTKNLIIISSGMSTLHDIAQSINRIYKKKIYKITKKDITKVNKNFLRKIKNKICVMHCVTDYPVENRFANLLSISFLKNKLGLNIGYSDHTKCDTAAIAAASLGITMIEKHFTLNKKMKGPDHKASLEPKEFKEMVRKIRIVEEMLGKYNKEIQQCEIKNIKIAKKNIVAKKNINKGEKFTLENITAKRPYRNFGPSKIDMILGKKAKRTFIENEKIIL